MTAFQRGKIMKKNLRQQQLDTTAFLKGNSLKRRTTNLPRKCTCSPRSISLNTIEVDTLRLTQNCPRGCYHCSQSPALGLKAISVQQFRKNIEKVQRIKQQTGNDILSDYLLTTTDSDPFYNRNLFELAKILFDVTGKQFYLLTSGWP